MRILFIEREEIVCLIILFYLFVYSSLYIKHVDMNKFKRLCIYGIVHVMMDAITVITVNSDKVSYELNYVFHLIFLLSAILFCQEVIHYANMWVFSNKVRKIHRNILWFVDILYVVAFPFMKVKFIEGNGTRYSTGLGVYIAYALSFFTCVYGIVIIVINVRRISHRIVISLLPMLFILTFLMIFQIALPEILLTGAGVTIVTIGVFFAIENPAKVYMQKAYLDVDTGARNRNCFDEDCERYFNRFTNEKASLSKFGIVVCDLNGLKIVNDTYGHLTGDSMIVQAVRIMKKEMKYAKHVYRTGGDEFAVVYFDEECDHIQEDINRVERCCKEDSKEYEYNISIAMGYAVTDGTATVKEIYKKADIAMYCKKKEMKASEADIR